ncbi:MAG: multicopper oxidase domain-containing protein, partial [Methylomonas sp.]
GMGMKHGGEQDEHGGSRRMGMGMMHGGGEESEGGGHGMMGMMMAMAHPIHFHGQSFQILSRTVNNSDSAAYASVKDGFIESGWKDTVLVMPGERVRLIKPFQDFKGLFMYHCHNLEHEDMGMMRDFLVE